MLIFIKRGGNIYCKILKDEISYVMIFVSGYHIESESADEGT